MENNFNYADSVGKIGMAVQSMVKEDEKRIMRGEHISAAPSNAEQAAELAYTRKKNRESKQEAEGRSSQ